MQEANLIQIEHLYCLIILCSVNSLDMNESYPIGGSLEWWCW